MSEINYIGIDLFSGAGGMAEGANSVGIDINIAVEMDPYSAHTYKENHPGTNVFNDDIRKFHIQNFSKKKNQRLILFGGPPCQGFSTSNQKTRNKENKNNWLFKEFFRVASQLKPDWIIIENVKGIIDTEGGFFLSRILSSLKRMGYFSNYAVLNAADFGVPQIRNRVFIVGSIDNENISFPEPTFKIPLTVNDAISDLPELVNGNTTDSLDYKSKAQNNYQRTLRGKSKKSNNNHVSVNSELVLDRYKHIPLGGNWRDIPTFLMKNYKDFSRCHTGIYHRLDPNKPSVVIGNYRKNMLIHPFENRGLSVREAARIQSFPDSFYFFGSIGYQQQQVGNSVPPLLAKAIFEKIIRY